jgi:hypothetical protein
LNTKCPGHVQPNRFYHYDFYVEHTVECPYGCSNNLFFSKNQLLTARRRGLAESSDAGDRFLRKLQTEGSSSDCFCPVDSLPVERDLDADEFQLIYQQNLVDAGANVVVEDIDEVIEVACADEERVFTTQFTYTFSVYENNVTQTDVVGLSGIMTKVYNNLILRYCDPLTHHGISITLNTDAGGLDQVREVGRRLQVGSGKHSAG